VEGDSGVDDLHTSGSNQDDLEADERSMTPDLLDSTSTSSSDMAPTEGQSSPAKPVSLCTLSC
jgi:hypothetical protein